MVSLAIFVILLALAVISPIGCSFLPTFNNERFVMAANDGQSLMFQVRGNYSCPISVEGSFPKWVQYVFLKFKDRDGFLKSQQDEFKYSEDFSSTDLVGGIVNVDRNSNTAHLSLEFAERYYFSEPVNGEYDLSNIRTPIFP